MKKMRGVTPDYEKSQADSSFYQKSFQFQDIVVDSEWNVLGSKEHSKFQIEIANS